MCCFSINSISAPNSDYEVGHSQNLVTASKASLLLSSLSLLVVTIE